ncbi:unnamed protein product, partial [Trichobilharzia regenti]
PQEDQQIVLDFRGPYQFEQSAECINDYLEVRDGEYGFSPTSTTPVAIMPVSIMVATDHQTALAVSFAPVDPCQQHALTALEMEMHPSSEYSNLR